MDRQQLRVRYWAQAIGWVALIYSTLYSVRPLCEFLKKTTPFVQVVNVGLIVLLAGILTVLWRRRQRILQIHHYVLLILVISCYAYGLGSLTVPEEKIHFVEYGFLAYLIFRALRVDFPAGRITSSLNDGSPSQDEGLRSGLRPAGLRSWTLRRTPHVYVTAFLLTIFFGWIDECIQAIVPNRYYQTCDVLLNAVSGLLGLALVYIFELTQINQDKMYV